MKRIIFLLLVGALALALSPRVHGQTSLPATGTPLPTPQPTPAATPAPKDLMLRAYAAQEQQGAVHWTEALTLTTPKDSRETDATHGDISWRDELLRQFTTAHMTNLHKKPNTTRVSKTTDLIAAGILASRTDKDPWDCSTIDISSSGSSGSGSEDLSAALLQNAQFTEDNLGLETLNGITVWHLRETMAIPGVTPNGKPGVGNYYIAQADETPVREKVSLTMNFLMPSKGSSYTKVKVIQHSVLDYSQYGETFHVTLPKACRNQKSLTVRSGSMLGVHAMWFQVVSRAVHLTGSQAAGSPFALALPGEGAFPR